MFKFQWGLHIQKRRKCRDVKCIESSSLNSLIILIRQFLTILESTKAIGIHVFLFKRL